MSLIHSLSETLEERSEVPALGFVRIGVSLAALGELLVLIPRFARLADDRIVKMPVLEWLPASSLSLTAAAILWMIGGLGFLVGFRSRVSGSLLTGAIGYTLLLDEQLYSNHLYFLGLCCMLLVVADAGAYLSRDAGKRDRRTFVWPIQLLKLQLTLMYGFAALAKLNLVYLSGWLMASSFRTEGLLVLPETWRTAGLGLPLSWAGLVIEAYLAFALWIRGSRPFAFALGLLFHVGILLTVSGTYELAIFAVATLSLYALFIAAEPRSYVVILAGNSPVCHRWARWLERMDWFRVCRIELASGNPLPFRQAGAAGRCELHLKANGDRYSGFPAVCALLEVLPVSFLWAPLLRIPQVRSGAEWLYARAWKAADRSRALAVDP